MFVVALAISVLCVAAVRADIHKLTPDEERARALFQSGVIQADRGNWSLAIRDFRAALDLKDSPNIQFNLARSLAQVGRIVEALELLDSVIADERSPTDVKLAAEPLRTQLRARLGRLRVSVEGGLAPGTLVIVDGRPLPEAALAA